MVNPNETHDNHHVERTNLSKNIVHDVTLANGSASKEEPKTAEVGVQTESSITDGLSSSKDENVIEDSSKFESPGPSYSVLGSERIQVDAVHPLFECYQKKRKTVGTSTTEDQLDLFYCSPCKTYFTPWLQALVDHFNNNYHEPDEFCVYCRGPVYFYMQDNNKKLYHKCDYNEIDTTASNDSYLGVNNNNNKSIIDKVQEK